MLLTAFYTVLALACTTVTAMAAADATEPPPTRPAAASGTPVFADRLRKNKLFADAAYEYLRFITDHPFNESNDSLLHKAVSGLFINHYYSEILNLSGMIEQHHYRTDSSKRSVFLLVGNAFYNLEQYRDALLWYNKLMDFDKPQPPLTSVGKQTRINKGLVHAHMGMYDKALTIWSEYDSSNRQVQNYRETVGELKNVKEFSPAKAHLFSVIPGGGYFYLKEHRIGTSALLLTSIFGILTYEAIYHKYYTAATFTGLLGCSWYIGSFHGAGKTAKRINKSRIKNLLSNLTL